MPPASGSRTSNGSDARFRQALADAQGAGARRNEEAAEAHGAAAPPPNPLAGAAFPVASGPPRATGGASHWRAALDFLEELAEPTPKVDPPGAPAETPEAILQELGLTENLTAAELNRLRRLFMWRNHPDRRGEPQRAGATRRVAIANMLIDRARARLTGAR